MKALGDGATHPSYRTEKPVTDVSKKCRSESLEHMSLQKEEEERTTLD